jgi:hypothetical protein
MWTLFFDGSKSNEGAGVGYILKDTKGKRFLITCRLEFQCTNNIVEYEALIQGLRKAMDLNVKLIKVFVIMKFHQIGTKYYSFHFKSSQTLRAIGMGFC